MKLYIDVIIEIEGGNVDPKQVEEQVVEALAFYRDEEGFGNDVTNITKKITVSCAEFVE